MFDHIAGDILVEFANESIILQLDGCKNTATVYKNSLVRIHL